MRDTSVCFQLLSLPTLCLQWPENSEKKRKDELNKNVNVKEKKKREGLTQIRVRVQCMCFNDTEREHRLSHKGIST